MGLTPTTSIHKFSKDYLLDSLFFNKAKLTHGGTNLDTSAPLLDISFIVELEINEVLLLAIKNTISTELSRKLFAAANWNSYSKSVIALNPRII